MSGLALVFVDQLAPALKQQVSQLTLNVLQISYRRADRPSAAVLLWDRKGRVLKGSWLLVKHVREMRRLYPKQVCKVVQPMGRLE